MMANKWDETAWMYCRKCKQYDTGEDDTKPCSGTPFDYPIHDGKPPCENYRFDKTKQLTC